MDSNQSPIVENFPRESDSTESKTAVDIAAVKRTIDNENLSNEETKTPGNQKVTPRRNLTPTAETIKKYVDDAVTKAFNKFTDSLKKDIKNYDEDFSDIHNSLIVLRDMLSVSDKEGNSFDLITLFNDLRQTHRKQINKIEELNEIIKRQRMQIDAYADDVLLKTQKPLIEEMISIREMIRKGTKGKNGKYGKNNNELINTIDKKIIYALKLIGVEVFDSGKSPFVNFDEKYQEVVPYTKVPIHKENEGLYISESPGYLWNMPAPAFNNESQNKAYIIKYEKIAKLQFDKSEKESSEDVTNILTKNN